MKVTYAEVHNFASYKHLKFEFQDQGLTLIAGPTGAGKSTLCDIIPWTLFGVTSKNGLADDVRSWNATAPTEGRLTVQMNGKTIEIVRVRGFKANDLLFQVQQPGMAGATRGKDLADTQRLLNEALGFDVNLYLAGAYFHEFSQTASFFTASAKVRRVVTEQMVDMTMAKSLFEKTTLKRKEAKTRGVELVDLRKETGFMLENAKVRCTADFTYAKQWDDKQVERILEAKDAKDCFEQTKEKELKGLNKQHDAFDLQQQKTITQYEKDVVALQQELQEDLKQEQAALEIRIGTLGDTKCGHCGATKDSVKRLNLVKQRHELAMRVSAQNNNKRAIANIENMIRLEKSKTNPFTQAIKKLRESVNTHALQVSKLAAETNPFLVSLTKTRQERDFLVEDYKALGQLIEEGQEESQDLELLMEVLEAFRTAIVKSAVSDLEFKTNDLLTKHFDAELRVTFDAAQADKLEATITKDGNECSYAQLSKGQRQLLKLCFGVAVMKIVANHNAVKFDAIFLDEFADGCDEHIKAKSFGLLQNLALDYGSVFAIDHSEGLKSMFNNRVDVRLENGTSQVEKAF